MSFRMPAEWEPHEGPGRDVVAVPAKIISYAGGGPHCTTMQIPSEGGAR